MTHSLHRRGDVESLKEDFVVLATPAIGFNHEGSGPKLKDILRMAKESGVVNIGDVIHGSIFSGADFDQIESHLKDGGRVRGVFADKEKLREFLQKARDKDAGLSMTVSGLMEDVFEVANDLGLTPHSVNLSLGIWGKRILLPSEEILEFTTMCGHGLISSELVGQCLRDIKTGSITTDQAVEKLAKPCVCGLFNTVRAKHLIEKAISSKT